MALCCRKCARTEFCISPRDWPSRWYLWTVYKLLTYGILEQFVTFIHCHPVYLFYENPTPKVSLVLPPSLTSGRRKNPECGLMTEELNKPIKCHVHLTGCWTCPNFRGNPKEKEVGSPCLNDATFMFFYVEMSACFRLDSAHMGERTGVRLWPHTTVGPLNWAGPDQQVGALWSLLLALSTVEHQSPHLRQWQSCTWD